MAETEDPESDPRWNAVRAAARYRVPTPPGLVERVLARTIATDRAPFGVRISAVAVEDDVVQVLVSVRFGLIAATAAEALRRELTAGLSRQLGVASVVNVHVVDVHPG
jgi:uncharacterized alkaline shock family protein YloU